MKKVVIAGSSSLQEKIQYWKKFREDKGYLVINYPAPIPKETFLEEYPEVHRKFFKDITETDILFVMNEDKNNIIGYLGAESFAEMCFGISRNLIHNKNIEVILLQLPENKVQSYDEINLWLKLNWITILKE
jgi:regulatory protein YycH of two-component signal transduction system YycFG